MFTLLFMSNVFVIIVIVVELIDIHRFIYIIITCMYLFFLSLLIGWGERDACNVCCLICRSSKTSLIYRFILDLVAIASSLFNTLFCDFRLPCKYRCT